MRKVIWAVWAVWSSAWLSLGFAQAIGVREELPAFEPLHLQGVHVGKRICPMCAYGNESGLVAFVPASLSIDEAARLKKTLEPAALGIATKQFRVFVIITGKASNALVETLRAGDTRWFVAELTGAELRNAEKDFGRSLSPKTWGYSFAHRKLLRELSADQLYGTRSPEIRLAANDAMQTFVQAEFATTPHRATRSERVVGLPCENCQTVFEGLPAHVGMRTRIGAEDEPGQQLRLSGHVIDPQGRPVQGILVYAYHTNNVGVYPRSFEPGSKLRLRAWAQTDGQGFYEFVTIRPGGYPGRPDPAHIHMHLIEPGRCTYYIDDVVFDDDPRLTEKQAGTRAGNGRVSPHTDFKGVWHATREIYLGRDIPGYEQCGT
ncbi:MAG TPA: hypothetical protein VK629_21875 [Steroidobacteraceae bacterium]|nr:hypothetical protein [Steroidobacteraceae bacterium]